MPQMKLHFPSAPAFERTPSFAKEPAPFYPDFASTLGQRQCSSQKNVFAAQPMM